MAIRICKFCGKRVEHTNIYRQNYIDDKNKETTLQVCSDCNDILKSIPDARKCYVCGTYHSKTEMMYREKTSGFDGAWYCNNCTTIVINEQYELEYKNRLKDLINDQCIRRGYPSTSLHYIQLENVHKQSKLSWFQLYCIAYWLVDNTKIELPRVIYRLGDWVKEAEKEFVIRKERLDSLKEALELKSQGKLNNEIIRVQKRKTQEEIEKEYEEKMRRIGISAYQPDVPEEIYKNRTEEQKIKDKQQNDFIIQQLNNMFVGRK